MEGFNGTLFCYGQTGSGKTFSMSYSCYCMRYFTADFSDPYEQL